MRENQYSIAKWADETFGRNRTAVNHAVRTNLEMAEFLSVVIVSDDLEIWQDEAADIVIMMYDFATLAGFDLHEAIDHKMKINRNRKWKVDETGHGQHVDEESVR